MRHVSQRGEILLDEEESETAQQFHLSGVAAALEDDANGGHGEEDGRGAGEQRPLRELGIANAHLLVEEEDDEEVPHTVRLCEETGRWLPVGNRVVQLKKSKG